MKRFWIVGFLSVFLFLSFIATNASAAGLGFYGTAGGGTSEWDADGFPGDDFDADTGHAGIGFVVDTNVAKDSVFNYRLQIGYERMKHEPEDTFFDDIKLDALVIDQDFGFGIVRNKLLRFWVGPELRLVYATGSPDNASDTDIHLWGIGIGPVAGINFNVSPLISLSVKGGLLATGYAGEMETPIGDTDYEMSEVHGFGTFAVLFKIDDTF
ncbi:MAG: hypothetical protein ACM34I_04500 [bacterium]